MHLSLLTILHLLAVSEDRWPHNLPFKVLRLRNLSRIQLLLNCSPILQKIIQNRIIKPHRHRRAWRPAIVIIIVQRKVRVGIILPSHSCLLEQRGRSTEVCRVAGGADSSYPKQRKTERSRWGTPCCTYRYRMWILAGCVFRGAPCFCFAFNFLTHGFRPPACMICYRSLAGSVIFRFLPMQAWQGSHRGGWW